jgi:hypothetical protein
MASTLESALTEAGDPSTSPKRLRELSLRKRKNERNQLRAVIAANPNVEQDLLLELAADHPKEVIGNPRFQLLQLSGEAWCENSNLHSLCSLALATGRDGHPSLKPGLRSLFQEVYDQYAEMVSVKRRETWCYERRVEILHSELGDNHPPCDISLDIKLCVLMEGVHDPWLEVNRDPWSEVSFDCDWICSILGSLRNECIVPLFEAFGQDPSEHVIVEDEVDEMIEITSSNPEIRIDGLSVVANKTGRVIFDVDVFYLSDEDADYSFQDGVLRVPVFEHVGGDAEGLCRGSKDDLGDLEPLWGWKPVALAPGIPEATWEEWLSAWIMS